MRAAIRASLARTGEDIGLVLSRALAGEVARRVGRGPAGIASGDDAAEAGAGGRPARAGGGGIARGKSQGAGRRHGQERGTGRGQDAE
ncbi:MAG: hypothetical protein K0M60_17140 [Hydrogenophaga sp.]|nr:hypothetical protein [Hydrogenophaga sp.]